MLNIPVPKTDAAIERWIEIYHHCKDLQIQYLEDWKEGKTKKSKPTMEDYVEHIQYETGDKYNKKTIYRILNAGKSRRIRLNLSKWTLS